jgi:lipoyl-dependent peroxiredoxin subunit C
MLTVGDIFPDFKLLAVAGGAGRMGFREIRLADYHDQWKVVFFWPMDFTFVCPTEIAEFGRRNEELKSMGAALLGASIDTHHVHMAWRKQAEILRDLPFPMLADTKRELAEALGIIHKDAGVALRATFIVDPTNTIRWASANDLSIGRNVDNVVRVLHALQSGGLTACNWQPGDENLSTDD